MAVIPKLTKGEEWLESEFKVDVAKFPPETREGGKKRKIFLISVDGLKQELAKIEKAQFKKLTSFKSGNPKFNAAQQYALTSFGKIAPAVKKGNIGAAVDAAGDVLSGLDEIGVIIGKVNETVKQLQQGGNFQAVAGSMAGVGDPAVSIGKKINR